MIVMVIFHEVGRSFFCYYKLILSRRSFSRNGHMICGYAMAAVVCKHDVCTVATFHADDSLAAIQCNWVADNQKVRWRPKTLYEKSGEVLPRERELPNRKPIVDFRKV